MASKRPQATIGILGGSGLYQMDALENITEHTVETPFGETSDALISGTISDIPVIFIARHGRGHRLLPSEVPYQANIFALKQCGVKYLVSLSAVGSLQEAMAPKDMVIPDQYIDLSKNRKSTFFGSGKVAHVPMAQPVCPELAQLLAESVGSLPQEDAVKLHTGGTYISIEGPQFSTLAESNWYRSLGASVIGMTNMPEAKLALEAQMAYASLSMVTDYDCWHPHEESVSADMAIRNLMENATKAQKITAELVKLIHSKQPVSAAHSILETSLVTPLDAMDDASKAIVEVLKR